MGYVQEGYVIFLDDDDTFVDNTTVEKIANVILNNDNPEDKIIIWQMIMPSGHLLPHTKSLIKKEIFSSVRVTLPIQVILYIK